MSKKKKKKERERTREYICDYKEMIYMTWKYFFRKGHKAPKRGEVSCTAFQGSRKHLTLYLKQTGSR